MMKMKGIQMASNHGLTFQLNEELNEFNGDKAPERVFFWVYCLFVWGFCIVLSLLFSGSQLKRVFPIS